MERLVELYSRLQLSYRILLLLVVCGLVGFISWTENYEGARSRREGAETSYDILKRKLDELGDSAKSVAQVEAAIAKANEDLTSLFQLLPADVDIDKLLANLADAAKETGIEVVSFLPRDGSKPAGTIATPPPPPGAAPNAVGSGALTFVVKIPIHMVFEGTFTQTASYFDRILSLPRVVKLDSFVINYKEVDNNSPKEKEALVAAKTNPMLKVDAVFVAYAQNMTPDTGPKNALPGTAPLGGAKAVPAIPPAGGNPPAPPNPPSNPGSNPQPLGGN